MKNVSKDRECFVKCSSFFSFFFFHEFCKWIWKGIYNFVFNHYRNSISKINQKTIDLYKYLVHLIKGRSCSCYYLIIFSCNVKMKNWYLFDWILLVFHLIKLLIFNLNIHIKKWTIVSVLLKCLYLIITLNVLITNWYCKNKSFRTKKN